MYTLLNAQWYQYLHDRDYHHDVYVMPIMKKVSHLTHHLIKYNHGLKPDNYHADTLACLLSMAGALNISLTKSFTKMELDIKFINGLVPYYINDRIDVLIGDNLKILSKSIEAWDHIEKYDYRDQIEKAICSLMILNFQSFMVSFGNKPNIEESSIELFSVWFKRLNDIKQNHVFYKYHHDSQLKNPTYRKIVEFYNVDIT